mgnify:FL=1
MTKAIKAAKFDAIATSTREANIDKCEMKGVYYCQCCGRELKPKSKTYQLRLIDGGDLFTEYEGEDIDPCTDVGWWRIGATCYKKYKKAEKETAIEVV